MFHIRNRFLVKICIFIVGATAVSACSVSSANIPAGLERIDPGGAYMYSDPTWSPSARQIAYVRYESPQPAVQILHTGEIFVYDLTNGQSKQLTRNDLRDLEPAWSPDGQEIIYVKQYDNFDKKSARHTLTDTLRIMKIDGSVDKEIYVCPFDCGMPRWSPDGKQISFYASLSWKAIGSAENPESDIYTINADGSELTKLTNSPCDASNPQWPLDGQRIAYICPQAKRVTIIDIQSRSTESYDLRDIGSPLPYITWFPDGKKILFAAHVHDSGEFNIYSLDVADHKVTPFLTEQTTHLFGPAHIELSPDGSKLLLSESNAKIYIADLIVLQHQ